MHGLFLEECECGGYTDLKKDFFSVQRGTSEEAKESAEGGPWGLIISYLIFNIKFRLAGSGEEKGEKIDKKI